MPGVLVAGNERREDKSKDVKMTVIGDFCKLVILLILSPVWWFNQFKIRKSDQVSLKMLHFSFQERIIEMN